MNSAVPMMWDRLDFMCGICKRGWTQTFKKKRQSLSCAPCGHVFHTRCIQRFMKTNDYCRSCGKPLNEALFNVTQVNRPFGGSFCISPKVEEKYQNALSSLKSVMYTYGIFVLVLIMGLLWWWLAGDPANVDEKSGVDESGFKEDIYDYSESFIDLDQM